MTTKRKVQVDLLAVQTSEQWFDQVSNDDMYTFEEVATAEHNLCIREIELMKSIKDYIG